MKRADFDKLTFGQAWHGVRLLALLVQAFRSGQRYQTDRAIENLYRRFDEAEEWLRTHGLSYGARGPNRG